MTCFHPIKMYKPRWADLDIPPRQYYALKKLSKHKSDFREEVQVACGHCLGCRLDHADMWATRLTMEAKCWTNNCFVTLTYNNPHLPMKNGKTRLVKEDLQKFLKRLRYYHTGNEEWINPKTGEYENPIRYYACGENGMSGTRAIIGGNPHFHIALFNFRPKDLKIRGVNAHGDIQYESPSLQKIWGKGYVVVEDLTPGSAGYITRYVQKKAGITPKKKIFTGRYRTEEAIDERNGNIYTKIIRETRIDKEENPEFQVMSRAVGIGYMYWEKNKEKIKRNSGIMINIKGKVKIKSIPRYFKKLWEDENWEEYHQWKYNQKKKGIENHKRIIEQINLPDYSEEEIYQFYLQQQEKILQQKAQSLKRNEFV